MFFNLNGWRQCRIASADGMECYPLVEALGLGRITEDASTTLPPVSIWRDGKA